MAITYIGSNGSATDTANIPTGLQAGDYIIVFAYRNATTAPTLGSGYTNIANQSANTNSFRVGYKVAVGNETTTGAWTNAGTTQVVVYRGVLAIGAAGSTTNASGASTTMSGITTMQANDSTSWVVSFGGSRQTTSMSTPSGLTLRHTQTGTTAMGIMTDTNAGVASWAQHTSTNGTAAAGVGGSIELRSSLSSTIALKQSRASTATGTATSRTVVWQNNTTTGNLVVVGIITDVSADDITGVTDSQGNTYTRVTGASGLTGGSATSFGAFYYAKNITGGTTPTITISFSTSLGANAVAMEFSGIDTTSPIDTPAIKRAVGSTAALNSGTSAATVQSNELLIGFGYTDWGGNTYTAGTNYLGPVTASATSFTDVAMEYMTTNAIGTQVANMTAGNASDWAMSLIPFKAASGSPAANTTLFFNMF